MATETQPNVVIVMGKCSRSKEPFGMRFEQRPGGTWACDWAFAVKAESARRERYDRGEIRGTIGFDPRYPGCPHCGAKSMFKCGCGKAACYDGETRRVTCPWCGASGDLQGGLQSLGAGGDR